FAPHDPRQLHKVPIVDRTRSTSVNEIQVSSIDSFDRRDLELRWSEATFELPCAAFDGQLQGLRRITDAKCDGVDRGATRFHVQNEVDIPLREAQGLPSAMTRYRR